MWVDLQICSQMLLWFPKGLQILSGSTKLGFSHSENCYQKQGCCLDSVPRYNTMASPWCPPQCCEYPSDCEEPERRVFLPQSTDLNSCLSFLCLVFGMSSVAGITLPSTWTMETKPRRCTKSSINICAKVKVLHYRLTTSIMASPQSRSRHREHNQPPQQQENQRSIIEFRKWRTFLDSRLFCCGV